MSELSQVLSTVTDYVTTAVYPNGTSHPSVAGVQVTIESGWPIQSQLDDDLKSGYAHVSVYPTNQERVVTKFGRQFETNTLTAPTIIATVTYVSGVPTVTLTGTVTLPQVVVIIADGIPYAYIVMSGDTLNTIAASLAALIPGATSLNNAISLPENFGAICNISTGCTATQELSRQERVFMVNVYAPNDPVRTALAGAIDITMKQNYRMLMPDGVIAQVFYSHNDDFDNFEKSLIYKRVLYYIIQYATTVTNNYLTIADIEDNISVVQSIN